MNILAYVVSGEGQEKEKLEKIETKNKPGPGGQVKRENI